MHERKYLSGRDSSPRSSCGDQEEVRQRRTSSNWWLESWKKPYGWQKKKLWGKVNDVATTTIQAWNKRLPEWCHEYEPQNIMSLDKLGLFFNALLEKENNVKEGKIETEKGRSVYYSSWWFFCVRVNCNLAIKSTTLFQIT